MNIPYVMKKCNKCGRWLVASTVNFHREKAGKYGIRATTPAIAAPNSPNEASITLLLNGVVYHILVFPVNLL